ncbi:MAG: DUF975 family protein [Bacteroidaceae bacterium]
MKANKTLMTEARSALRGNWGLAVLVVFVYLLIQTALTYSYENVAHALGLNPYFFLFLQIILSIIISGPLVIGLYYFFLKLARDEDSLDLQDLFWGFRTTIRCALTYLLMTIFTLLWTLLFIIPGIIASFSYALTPFIINEEPNLSPNEAIDRSKKMMRGHKWEFFCLQCRFIGWGLLAICFTLCIGLLWVAAYAQTSIALFYEEVKRVNQEESTENNSEQQPLL